MKRRSARARSEAARRGWATRRANAEHARRSAAARAGWERRRAESERRSAAARKGWETRVRRQAETPIREAAVRAPRGEPEYAGRPVFDGGGAPVRPPASNIVYDDFGFVDDYYGFDADEETEY